MSRASQIARQQRRAFCILADTVPAAITIDGMDYEVALVTGSAALDSADGLRLAPDSITYWLPKSRQPVEPVVRARVSHGGIDYFVDEVSGRGALHENWRVRAVRHRPR